VRGVRRKQQQQERSVPCWDDDGDSA
jgi:hypothetical protein